MKNNHYYHLRKKWLENHKSIQNTLWTKHKDSISQLLNTQKQLAIGSLSGIMLLSSPHLPQLPEPEKMLASGKEEFAQIGNDAYLLADLGTALPEQVQQLSMEEEKKVAEVLSKRFGMTVSAELEGKRLNKSYGLIGAEQHLARYRGDTMESHFDNEEDAQKYWSSGMAPGLGAWGYFTENGEFTDKSNMREKYYIAVQTFLSQDFQNRFAEYRDFYRFRKMLVVNPQNGKAIVVVIGDAGPAVWTGKHLGGSPEVMKYLERKDGRQRGPVLYFFIDDPNDSIPLGPVTVKEEIPIVENNLPFSIDQNLDVTNENNG